MKQIKPLAKFSIIETNRVEEAEVELTKSLAEIRIMRVQNRSSFGLHMNGVNFPRTSLVFNQFGCDAKINAGLDEESALFIIGGNAPTIFHLEKGSVIVSSQTAAMISSGKQMRIERSENSEALVLRTSQSDLLQHFEKLTARHHRGTIIFDHNISLTNGSGAVLIRMMNYLIYELEHNDLMMKNPGLLKSYDDMLLSALISLPNNKREKLYKNHHYQSAPGLVHRAEEYMRAHLNKAISIIDLLQICDCSRSVLFSAFRNARGYTPMEFLTEQRLQGAREKLLKQHSENSVSSIALDYGFLHLGRFSQAYKKRFGEFPSKTLGR